MSRRVLVPLPSLSRRALISLLFWVIRRKQVVSVSSSRRTRAASTWSSRNRVLFTSSWVVSTSQFAYLGFDSGLGFFSSSCCAGTTVTFRFFGTVTGSCPTLGDQRHPRSASSHPIQIGYNVPAGDVRGPSRSCTQRADLRRCCCDILHITFCLPTESQALSKVLERGLNTKSFPIRQAGASNSNMGGKDDSDSDRIVPADSDGIEIDLGIKSGSGLGSGRQVEKPKASEA
jgi:hypothetical protein